jgi:hypothetical protein
MEFDAEWLDADPMRVTSAYAHPDQLVPAAKTVQNIKAQ